MKLILINTHFPIMKYISINQNHSSTLNRDSSTLDTILIEIENIKLRVAVYCYINQFRDEQ